MSFITVCLFTVCPLLLCAPHYCVPCLFTVCPLLLCAPHYCIPYYRASLYSVSLVPLIIDCAFRTHLLDEIQYEVTNTKRRSKCVVKDSCAVLQHPIPPHSSCCLLISPCWPFFLTSAPPSSSLLSKPSHLVPLLL